MNVDNGNSGSGSGNGTNTTFPCPLCATHHHYHHYDQHIIDIIHKHLGIELRERDKENICPRCEQTVIAWDEFARKCWAIHTQFENKASIKTEDDSYVEVKVEQPVEGTDEKLDDPLLNLSLTNIYDELPRLRSGKHRLLKDEIKSETFIDNDTVKHKNRKSVKNRVPSIFEYKCHVCPCEFKYWAGLKRHCFDEHSSLPRVSCICGKWLSSSRGLSHHRRAHTTTEGLKCNRCGKEFLSGSALKNHYEVVHMPKEEYAQTCDLCSEKFPNLSSLRLHVKNHHTKPKYPCDVCGLEFTSKSNAKAHKLTRHGGAKNKICDICGKGFVLEGSLKSHRVTHIEERNFKCEKCGKAFKSAALLKIHLPTHDEATIECPQCPAVFTAKRNLRDHLVCHSDDFKHACKYCAKRFKRKRHLKVHIDSHEGAKRYGCDRCPKSYSCSTNLKLHKSKKHPTESEKALSKR